MALGDDWDAKTMLDLYLYDYMIKKRMYRAAAIFRKEANVCGNPVVIDSAEGFLYEWWSVFYEIYMSRQKMQGPEGAETSVKAGNAINNKGQLIHPAKTLSTMNTQKPPHFPMNTDFDNKLGQRQQMASLWAAKQCDKPHWEGHEVDLHLQDTNKLLNFSKLAASSSSHLQQQIRSMDQQGGDRSGIGLGRTLPINTEFHDSQQLITPRNRLCDDGEGAYPVPLDGKPVNLLNSLFSSTNIQQQFQTLSTECQQLLLAQFRTGQQLPAFPGSSSHFNEQNAMLLNTYLMGNNELNEQGTRKRRNGDAQSTLDCTNAGPLPTEENVESFLSNNDDNADIIKTPFSILKRRCVASAKNENKGFTFQEVCCLRSSKSKVLCCHFSSDGKFLASAGHEKKVYVWNAENFDHTNSSDGHSFLITDVRFRSNSTLFATSSFDKTVKIWDASRASKSLLTLHGHGQQAMSLDFHPRKRDLLCSCDINDEIRLWNINEGTCTRISKGATKQVRFQPRVGKLLATAAGNVINVIDVETNSLQFCLKGHCKDILSISWDISGKYIASVSEDGARVWSAMSGGKSIHELSSNGSKFQSCTFHPGYTQLLIIGGYQSLELWNASESNKTWAVPAHNGLIPAVADSPQTEMIASASHDQCVKIWK